MLYIEIELSIKNSTEVFKIATSTELDNYLLFNKILDGRLCCTFVLIFRQIYLALNLVLELQPHLVKPGPWLFQLCQHLNVWKSWGFTRMNMFFSWVSKIFEVILAWLGWLTSFGLSELYFTTKHDLVWWNQCFRGEIFLLCSMYKFALLLWEHWIWCLVY